MLTQNQNNVLEFIAGSIRSGGIPPSIYEVSNGTGLGYNIVRFAMMDLEKLGFIKRHFNKPRAISVLKWPNKMKDAA